jgi:threonine/homoserine efflux transporter RhtA
MNELVVCPVHQDLAEHRVSLLPATATVIGIVVLTQIPTAVEVIGVALVVVGVAVHQQRASS